MISRSLRSWCYGIAISFVSLGLVGNANADFLGDDVTVSLTVHTTGAVDQDVWSSDTETIGALVEFAGDSEPAGAGAPLLWNLDFDDNCCFTLSVEDVNLVGPTTVDPLVFTVTFADNTNWIAGLPGGSLAGNVIIGAPNDFGFLAGDISVAGNTITISVPGGALAGLPLGGTLSTEFCVVPEVSSIAMMTLAATGMAGGIFWRRRRSA